MNQVFDVLNSRKSTRGFTDQPISESDKQSILKTALRAPTGGNMSLYTILDITDQQLKDRLSLTCDNQPFIKTAKMVLVFCADYNRWYSLFKKYEDDTYTVRKPGLGDMMLACEDTAIIAHQACIAAQSLGIGSCYIGDILENYEIHKQILNLPDFVVPFAMLVFGYPNETEQNRKMTPRFEVEDMVHENGYDLNKANNMFNMLKKRNSFESDEKLNDWIKAFCDRKWNSDFSKEMSRSVSAMIDDWKK